MKPGRKADIWLARNLLGWETRAEAGKGIWWDTPAGPVEDVPAFTTDIGPARWLAEQSGVSVRGRDPWRICQRIIKGLDDAVI